MASRSKKLTGHDVISALIKKDMVPDPRPDRDPLPNYSPALARLAGLIHRLSSSASCGSVEWELAECFAEYLGHDSLLSLAERGSYLEKFERASNPYLSESRRYGAVSNLQWMISDIQASYQQTETRNPTEPEFNPRYRFDPTVHTPEAMVAAFDQMGIPFYRLSPTDYKWTITDFGVTGAKYDVKEKATATGKKYFVKFPMKPKDPKFRDVKREAREAMTWHLLSRIGEHRNISSLLGYCHASDIPLDRRMTDYPGLVARHRGEDVLRSTVFENYPAAFQTIWEITEGLAYIHSRGLIHGDMNPSNIIIEIDSGGQRTPMICDFGSSQIENGGKGFTSDSKSDAIWRPPEHDSRPRPTKASDIYSMGLIMFHVFARKSNSWTNARARDQDLIRAPVLLREDREDPGRRYVWGLIQRCLRSYGLRPTVERMKGALLEVCRLYGWVPSAER